MKSTFSVYGRFAYQIKENEACNNMLANILPLHPPLIPGFGSKGHFFSLLKVVIYQINRNETKHLICPFTHPRHLDGIKRSKPFFSEGHIAYQITWKEG